MSVKLGQMKLSENPVNLLEYTQVTNDNGDRGRHTA